MTVKTGEHERRRFYELHQQGSTYAEIAQQYGVSAMLVRYWCRRQRDGKGWRTVRAERKRRLLSRFHPLVGYGILRLRLKHKHWGPKSIREHLKKRPSLLGKPLPSEAEIGRYVHQWRRFRRKAGGQVKRPAPATPTQVHQRWQLDFKMQIGLQNGQWVNLFSVRDPVGEAYIGNYVYRTLPHARVKLEEARAVLRCCFEHWGTLPDEVQTDGESTLVSPHPNDFPSPFTLWLIGLGIQHRVIHKVTQNAAVERCHRTVYEYAVEGNPAQSPEQLQQTLDQARYELNYLLPSQAKGCAGRPPIAAHPELLQPRRPFQTVMEGNLFDLQRVDQYLATFTWTHRVSHTGQVHLGQRGIRYTLPRAWAGQEVEIRFDPQDRQLIFSPVGQPEEIIRRCPIKGSDVSDLTGREAWPIGVGAQQLLLPHLFDKRGKLLMSK